MKRVLIIISAAVLGATALSASALAEQKDLYLEARKFCDRHGPLAYEVMERRQSGESLAAVLDWAAEDWETNRSSGEPRSYRAKLVLRAFDMPFVSDDQEKQIAAEVYRDRILSECLRSMMDPLMDPEDINPES